MSRNAAPRPLIVQSDRTILLETGLPDSDAARDRVALFAEMVTSPEHVQTWRLTPLSLWSAAAAGVDAATVLSALETHSRFPLPEAVRRDVVELLARWGRLRLEPGAQGDPELVADDPLLLATLGGSARVGSLFGERLAPDRVRVPAARRGDIKQELLRAGWPVEDVAGYVDGEPLPVALRQVTRGGTPFALRDYQRQAADTYHAGGTARGGSGVVVLPCGAGKTLVGLAVLARLSTSALVLTTSVTALRQWRSELLERTTLEPEQIGEYSGARKEVAPVTLATYQILTHRRRKDAPFEHLERFRRRPWGVIIYDEVHLLPAPVFRMLAELQSRRRLGLTATLVREDGREGDVFALVGPRRYDAPWRTLEAQGAIATAACVEVRVPMAAALRRSYAAAGDRERFRVAATNPAKDDQVVRLLARHPGERALVIGQYLDQLRRLARRLDVPLLTGATPQAERDTLYGRFRDGDLGLLVVSKVANFAVDLPDASVAVQISGTFGSRQEEAQRLGRLLRPKSGGRTATFYTVVSTDSVEAEFARRRQIFLAEQGYRYGVETVG